MALFTAVSTLNLATSVLSTISRLIGAAGAVWPVHCSVSVAGAVINISVLFVVGDRLAVNGTLDRRQVIILTGSIVRRRSGRPFFIAMAVALTYAPACSFLALTYAPGMQFSAYF